MKKHLTDWFRWAITKSSTNGDVEMPVIKSRYNPNTNKWELGYWVSGWFLVVGTYPELSEEQKN